MKTNHKEKRGSEVEALTQYDKWGIQVEGGVIEYLTREQVLNLVGSGGSTITRNGKTITIDSKNTGRTVKVVQGATYTLVPEDFTSKILMFLGPSNTTVSVNMASIEGIPPENNAELYILTADSNVLTFNSLEPSVLAVTCAPDKKLNTLSGYCYVTALLGPIDSAVASEGALHFSGDLDYDSNGNAAIIEGTITVTSNITLNSSHNQKTLLCQNSNSDITITVPSGLGEDFTCNFISVNSGTKYTNIIAGGGVTFVAPHGTKLLTDYPCNIIKETGAETFYLQGELTS